jgi:hypothetical protein
MVKWGLEGRFARCSLRRSRFCCWESLVVGAEVEVLAMREKRGSADRTGAMHAARRPRRLTEADDRPSPSERRGRVASMANTKRVMVDGDQQHSNTNPASHSPACGTLSLSLSLPPTDSAGSHGKDRLAAPSTRPQASARAIPALHLAPLAAARAICNRPFLSTPFSRTKDSNHSPASPQRSHSP